MIAKIITLPINANYLKTIPFVEEDLIIAVDRAALMMLEHGIHFDLAIGDFDSVTKAELDRIKEKSDKIITFEKKKDFTDSYLAVKEALKYNPEEIIIYGGIGKRIDHTYANLELLMLGNIQIQSETSCLYTLEPGVYHIENHYKYISFFAIENIKNLTLKGFEFELEEYNLDRFDPLCISNHGQGEITFTKGTMLVIHQNEKST
jgi:thiamine pyrophosphokinase